MDILIDDADIPNIAHLITGRPNRLPCDIYSVTGSDGFAWRGIPYLQRTLSLAILASRRLHNGIVYVPCGEEGFAALAYHAVYHKGRESGLIGSDGTASDVGHDYRRLLQDIARAEQIEVEISLLGISQWLNERGYTPSRDLLSKLVDARPELEIVSTPAHRATEGGELCVFVVREAAEDDGLVDELVDLITIQFKLDLILSVPLEGVARERCRDRLRGGKWDRGPYPKSGGAPARILAAYDYYPKPLPIRKQRKYRHATNRHVVDIKEAFRRVIYGTRFFTRTYNGLHSSDNEVEAFEYVRLTLPEHEAHIREETKRRRARFAVKGDVIRVLREGRRARVELVNHDSGPSVRKTFRVGCERFFERELFAVRHLSKELEFIPRCIEYGEGYYVIPYYENVLVASDWLRRRRLLARNRANIVRVIRALFERGFTLIDFSPENVIITVRGEFYVVDFEFLQEYEKPPLRIDDAYEVVGFPPDFRGDVPFGLDSATSSFGYRWRWYIGGWRQSKRLP